MGMGRSCGSCGGGAPTGGGLTLTDLQTLLAGQRVVLAGSQVLPFDDMALVQLTVPAGANLAEISIEGGSVRFTTDGVDPVNGTHYGHRQFDGSRIELESASEVTGFRLLGLPSEAGSIYVEYFIVPLIGLNG